MVATGSAGNGGSRASRRLVVVPIVAALPRLLLVTDRHATEGRDLVSVVVAAAGGGLRFVQLREKDLPEEEIRKLLQRLKAALPSDLVLAVNGRPAIARDEAVILHLPAGQAPTEEGEGLFRGQSVHDREEARQALLSGARYLVVGPIFPTASKPGHSGSGIEPVREIVALDRSVPVFAIGGIKQGNVDSTLRTGAYGVAVRSAILSAADPRAATRALLEDVDAASAKRGLPRG